MKILMNKIKNEEKGMFSIFAIFIMMCVIALAGLFINVTIGYMSVNFAKKAMQESTRVRALAVDMPVKENTGIVEVMNYPYTGSHVAGYTRPSQDLLGNPIKSTSSQDYQDAVYFADMSAKSALIQSVDSFLGNRLGGKDFVGVNQENICYDVQPLKATPYKAHFECALKGTDGKVYTVSTDKMVKGYNDVYKGKALNKFDDATLSGNNSKVVASNVVLGAAIIEPHSFFNNIMVSLGFGNHQNQTVIYSIAYPQIDKCYGSFC